MASRKAQAALEFLSTYGWAFLVIVGVLGTMAYFGIGNVTPVLPTSCNLGTGTLVCGGFIALENGTFAFEFTNRESKTINLSNVVCVFPRTDNATRLVYDVTSTSIQRGQTGTIICPSWDILEITDKDQFKVKIVYFLNETGALPKVTTGELLMGPTVNDDPVYLLYEADVLSPDTVSPWYEP